MDFSKFAHERFISAVLKLEPPNISPELKRKLLKEDHERVKIFLSNMAAELTKVQVMRRRKGKKPADLKNLIWLVEEMTKVFVASIEIEAKRRIESDLARLKREQDATLIKEMDETLAGKPQGIFEEMGVITDENILGPERDKTFSQTQAYPKN